MSSRRSSELSGRVAAVGLLVLGLGASVALHAEAATDTPDAAPAVAAPPPPPRSYPARAVADYERALDLARRGEVTEAELEFGQLAAAYPQFAGPQINIGLLRRKAGNLEAAEQALRLATERNPNSATAWTELGVTLRMLGRFEPAAEAHQRAIAVDPNHAAAHRNLGVVLDLYLDRPVEALAAFERYRDLGATDRQLSAWIAELKQRVARLQPPSAATEEGS
ncbi:MAG: tetratricopeptide repeat protein [Steroidobacteraceae bacterium]